MLMPTVFVLVVAVALLSGNAETCGPGRAGARRRGPRKLTPLVYKQHVPNVEEVTLGASGPMEDKITRTHPKFKELSPNYNPDIYFKDEEGTGSDRLMTKRCKEKLNTLAISVMNQWPGVRLRVTEAWDDESLHSPESLHYSARAVDITTSDRDRSKYGMLARLAVEAGFDWVYYESRSHIHASVKTESADVARTGGCFHGDSLVQTPTGTSKMSELSVGDQVLVVDSSGQFRFSEVIMFLDRDEATRRLYRTVETESGQNITLTPSHLIYTSDVNSAEDFLSQAILTFARNIKPGHYVYTSVNNADSPSKRTQLDRVLRVRTTSELGVYAPLTNEGTIVVNNVLASCYAVFNQQTVAHLAFLPVRIVENMKRSLIHLLQTLQFSQKDTHSKTLKQHGKKLQGIHWYPKFLYSAAHLVLPERLLYH